MSDEQTPAIPTPTPITPEPAPTPEHPTGIDYLWSVAAKNISYDAGKVAAAIVSAQLAKYSAYKYGLNVNVDHFQIEVASAVAVFLAWLHDILRAKIGKRFF